MSDTNYNKMWEDFGKMKSAIYLNYKFLPTHRVGLTNHLREEMIFKLLDPRETNIVLDVGCASGRQLFQISNQIKEGYGTDIAKSFINKCNSVKEGKEVNNLYFKVSEVESLSFNDKYFDKIICAEVLEHVFDFNIAVKEIRRVLKDGGEFIITVPNMNADATIWGRFLRLVKVRKFNPIKVFSKEELAKHGDAHVREFDKKTIIKRMESNNFKIIEIKSVSFIDGPYFDYLIKFLLYFRFTRLLVIFFEKFLTKTKIMFGRHLILKAIKDNKK
ncbi:MAG: class I SAM-dependent methyltransferase [Candidatus Helarchaeota archaeon]